MSQQVRLAGVEAAHATVRRRRHYRIATVSAAVVALVLAPVVAFAVLRGNGANPPDVGASPGVTTAAPSPTGSATPSGPPALRLLGDPYGATVLDEALLPLPNFQWQGCPSGPVQFHSRQWKGTVDAKGFTPTVDINEVATGDVNGDGAADVVALLACTASPLQGNRVQQVAAYTKNATGDYALLGQVLLGSGTVVLGWPQVQPDGSVRVAETGPVEPAIAAASKWRSFRWTGTRFEESGAPVAIPPIETPTQLSVTVTPAALTSTRTTLTVTVRNGGSTASDYLLVSFASRAPMTIKADGLPANLVPIGCQTPTGCHWAVRVEPVPPGQSASGTFTIELTGTAPSGAGLEVSVGGWLRGPGGQPNADDANKVTVPITVS